MEVNDFSNEISEKNKEALQSKTWQQAREIIKAHEAIKADVKHFTAEPALEDGYGEIWGQVVKEYLKTGYKSEQSSNEVTMLGMTYKALRRSEVTVFYDADGNTLFDVENKRLEAEYEQLQKDSQPEENLQESVKSDLATAGSATEAVRTTVEENSKSAKQGAKEKLEEELRKAKDKSFAEPIIGYLLKRCEEDEGLAQDVVQGHKTWGKCFDYLYEQARKQAEGNRAVIRDDVVYEWAEDYYHKDDKAEEAAKAKKVVEVKKKAEKPVDKKTKAEPKTKDAATPVEKKEVASAEPKPKKNGKDMDGQMDFLSMLGL